MRLMKKLMRKLKMKITRTLHLMASPFKSEMTNQQLKLLPLQSLLPQLLLNQHLFPTHKLNLIRLRPRTRKTQRRLDKRDKSQERERKSIKVIANALPRLQIESKRSKLLPPWPKTKRRLKKLEPRPKLIERRLKRQSSKQPSSKSNLRKKLKLLSRRPKKPLPRLLEPKLRPSEKKKLLALRLPPLRDPSLSQRS
jgi:hypothetical protein